MIYAFIGSITMGLMNVVAKVLRNYTKVSALQVTFWRSFGMAVGCFIFCKIKGHDILEVPRSVSMHLFLRVFFGYISVACMFLAIFLLPFSLAMVLNFT